MAKYSFRGMASTPSVAGADPGSPGEHQKPAKKFPSILTITVPRTGQRVRKLINLEKKRRFLNETSKTRKRNNSNNFKQI